MVILFLIERGTFRKQDHLSTIVDTMKHTTEHVDNSGNIHTQVTGKTYTEEEVKSITDSLRKNTGLSKVVTVIKEVYKIDTEFIPDIMYIDSTTHTITDSFNSRYCQIIYKGSLITKQGEFKLNLTPDTVTHTLGFKDHLFKADELTVDFQHSNKLVTTIDADIISTKVPRVEFAVGPFIGISLLGKPIFGIGVSYNLLPLLKRK
jgi:hypothetical protein